MRQHSHVCGWDRTYYVWMRQHMTCVDGTAHVDETAHDCVDGAAHVCMGQHCVDGTAHMCGYGTAHMCG